MTEPKPRFFLLMMQCPSFIGWCELEADEWEQVEAHPKEYRIFVVDGQRATVCVATRDFALKYSDALKTASLFVLGAWVKVSIDLDKLDGSIQTGQPKIHPPL